MSDLIEKLLRICEDGCDPDLPYQAISEIEQLRAKNARLRKAISLCGRRCEEVHHPIHMLHSHEEPCPVEVFIEEALGDE